MAALPALGAGVAIGLGALTICGWALGIERLRQPLTQFVAMNPATAVAFILAGIALALCAESRRESGGAMPTKIIGAAVALIGAAKLVGFALKVHPNVDELLFSSALSANRMAPNTALDFVLVGLAIVALDVQVGGTSFGQIFAIAASFGALLPLTGYLYGVRSFEGVASFIPMAPHTALTFLLVCAGLFFRRPRLALTQTFATRDPRGVLARRLAPFAVVLTLALGWARLAGEQRGYYNAPFGTALFAVVLSLLFVALVAWAASTVGRADKERNQANLALLTSKLQLEESFRETQLIIDYAREIICTIDAQGTLLTMNSASEEILGRGAQALIGSRFCNLHCPADRGRVEEALQQVQTGFQRAGSHRQLHQKRRDPCADRMVASSLSPLPSHLLRRA